MQLNPRNESIHVILLMSGFIDLWFATTWLQTQCQVTVLFTCVQIPRNSLESAGVILDFQRATSDEVFAFSFNEKKRIYIVYCINYQYQ